MTTETNRSVSVLSVVDVALWFIDKARGEGGYINIAKLHRLLLLVQGMYAVRYYGRKFMPSCFIVDRRGLREANVHRLFADGPLDIPRNYIENQDEAFIKDIWLRYGLSSVEQLDVTVRYDTLRSKYGSSEVAIELSLEEIMSLFMSDKERSMVHDKKHIRTASGKFLKKWTPKTKVLSREQIRSRGHNIVSNLSIEKEKDNG